MDVLASTKNSVRIGLIDSGVTSRTRNLLKIISERDFTISENRHHHSQGSISHGNTVAALIKMAEPNSNFSIAKIFDDRVTASLGAVCPALEWIADQRLDLVNISFGTRQYSEQLEAACKKVHNSGALIICSSPARGGAVYPAAFEFCTAVTGDARCLPGQTSWLNTSTSDFGTHPFVNPNCASCGGGSSFAAARFTGLAAKLIAERTPRDSILSRIKADCLYVGAEKRINDSN